MQKEKKKAITSIYFCQYSDNRICTREIILLKNLNNENSKVSKTEKPKTFITPNSDKMDRIKT